MSGTDAWPAVAVPEEETLVPHERDSGFREAPVHESPAPPTLIVSFAFSLRASQDQERSREEGRRKRDFASFIVIGGFESWSASRSQETAFD